MIRSSAPFVALGLIVIGASSAQNVKLSAPMPFGPEANGERVFESAIGAGRVIYRADQDEHDVFELFSAPLDGSAPAVKLNGALPAGGDVLSFQLTPDGTRVLYLADQTADEDYTYFSVPSDGSAPPVRLSDSLDYWARQQTPRITADSGELVYLGLPGAYRLLIKPMDGSGPPRELASNVDAFILTPDSRRAVFVDNGFRVANLYSVLLDGSAPPVALSIGEHGAITELGTTHDGARVVYLAWGTSGSTSGSRELFSVPSDGSAGRVRLSATLHGTRNVESFAVAPDDARVVYLANQVQSHFELFSAPIDGTQAAASISGTQVFGANVEGSPAFEIARDGRWVAFRSDREQDQFFRLYRTRLDGSAPPERVTDLAVDAFELDATGTRAVFLHPLAGGTEELVSALLVPPPRARDLNGNLRVAQPAHLCSPALPGGTVLGFAIAPDAQRVVYHASADSPQVELFSVPIDGSAAALELNDPFVAGGNVDGPVAPHYHVSPDSSRVVFQADQELDQQFELYSVRLDRAQAPVKLNGPLDPGPIAGDVLEMHLSPDGTRFVYWADGEVDQIYGLYGGRLDGTVPVVRLSAPPVANRWAGVDFKFSPDGQRTVFLSDQEVDQRFELYSVPSDGSAAPVKLNQPIFGTGSISTFAVSPASARVVFGWGERLFSAPLQGGASPLELTPGIDVGVPPASLRFVPGDDRVLFLTPAYSEFGDPLVPNLFAVPSDASQPPLPLANPQGVYEFDVLGEHVVYLADPDAQERLALFDTSLDGATPVRLSGAGGSVREARISPSQRVLYLADANVPGVVELFGAQFTGAPPVRPLGGAPRAPRVKLNGVLAAGASVSAFESDPLGARVAFTVQGPSRAQLFSVPIDRRSPPIALSAAADDVRNFRFSPDGQRVVYAARDALTSAVQLYSVLAAGGSGPVVLNGALVSGGNVNLWDSGQAYRDASFTISPDGHWVAYLADQEVDERFELYLRPLDGSGSATKLNGALVPGGDVAGYGLLSPAFLFSADSHGIVYLADQDTDEVVELFRSSVP